MQSLVQRALADGGACQPPVAGDSTEQLGEGCSMYGDLGLLAY